jgi:hypothetical protein
MRWTDSQQLAAEFDENLDVGELHAEYRRLAAEQGALRRLAALVARSGEPMEVFGAVAEEMRRGVPADTVGLWRFENDGEITIVAAAADPAALARWPVGTRTPLEGNTIAALPQRNGRPARMDSYDNIAGPIAARVRGWRASGGGGANHRRRARVGPGSGRLLPTRPHAGRHRGVDQPLSRADCYYSDGRSARRAKAATVCRGVTTFASGSQQ